MDDEVPKYAMIVFIRLGQQVLEYYPQQAILDIFGSQSWQGQMGLTMYHFLKRQQQEQCRYQLGLFQVEVDIWSFITPQKIENC